MKQSIKIIFSVCLAITAITCSAKDATKTSAAMPAVVQAQPVKAELWQAQIQATGSLAAFQGIMVKPEISGRVTHIYFKSGQNVTQGTPLVALDEDVLAAQLELNKANLTLRQNEFQRANQMYKTHVISKADFDTARANLITAQAQVDEVVAQIKQATITAPFSGRLGLRQISLGDYVTAGQSIVNLQALDPIVVNFNLPEIYLNQIAVGDNVAIHSDAYPKQNFIGKVYAFDSAIDPNTRTLAVRASIDNKTQQLLPGGFVEITLLAGTKAKMWVVPEIALQSDLQGSYVYKIVNGRAVRTAVVVASRNDQNAFIASGLNPGDIIITAGQIKITENNMPVMIAK